MAFQNVKKCVINTGNILSLNDITKKPGQSSTEELSEAISITLKEFENSNICSEPVPDQVNIYRPNDDLKTKMAEQSLSDLKIGLKIFLNSDNKAQLKEAIEEGFKSLQVQCVHNVVIAYKKKITESEEDVESLKSIWSVLEEYVKEEKINQIGLADIEEATFRNIFEWSNVKPTIIQINLATCCVVPPTLQAFCKDNDVQLLTHSDPSDILPVDIIKDLIGGVSLSLEWVLRYLVHIKCRGVLITKGYLVSLGQK